jgi:hypothetical protein
MTGRDEASDYHEMIQNLAILTGKSEFRNSEFKVVQKNPSKKMLQTLHYSNYTQD